MNEWKITGFAGINNMADPSSLEQPVADKNGNIGNVELQRCINFDVDDEYGLSKRDNSQQIFSQEFDSKLTQRLGGITFTAIGRHLRYTLPFKGDEDDRRSVISYANPITLIQEIEVGMWVSTSEKIMFHSGRNPTEIGGFTLTAEYNFSAIEGTGEKVHSSKLGLDSGGFVAVFATERGICYGTNSGQLINMSEGTFSYPVFSQGISYIKEENGMVQYQVKMINGIEDSFNQQERTEAIEIDSVKAED